MIEGHTVDVLLLDSFRNHNSLFYQIWYSMRGYTAPIFIFTAGIVFSFLLFRKPINYTSNARIQKGIIRGASLILIGYFLRYPTWSIFDFRFVTTDQWFVFFAVDALHLIGISILLALAFIFLLSKNRLCQSSILWLIGLILLIAAPFINNLEWSSNWSIPFTNYFTRQNGSIFPLFPYAGYFFWGVGFGKFFNLNSQLLSCKKFNGIGAAITIVVMISLSFADSLWFWNNNDIHTIIINLSRMVAVLFLFLSINIFSINLRKLPGIITKLAKNSLAIYIVHIVLLYGSAWSVGLNRFFSYSFNLIETFFAVILMFVSMFFVAFIVEKLKVRYSG